MRPKPLQGGQQPGGAGDSLDQTLDSKTSQLKVQPTARPNRTQSQQRNTGRQAPRPTTQGGQLKDAFSFGAASVLPSINDQKSTQGALGFRRRASQPPVSVYKQYLKAQTDLSFSKRERDIMDQYSTKLKTIEQFNRQDITNPFAPQTTTRFLETPVRVES